MPTPKSRAPRSIPACTGKPARRARASTEPGVYPRMYGEPPFDVLRFPFQVGLSPHVRGTVWRTCSPTGTSGLSPHVRGNLFGAPGAGKSLGSIPACTGKPATSLRVSMPAAVYPRMYGETNVGRAPCIAAGGLSPHVRGNQEILHRHGDANGSIPACTGKPSRSCPARIAARVYPRMYGETSIAMLQANGPRGLSPHVRGNPRSRRVGAGR